MGQHLWSVFNITDHELQQLLFCFAFRQINNTRNLIGAGCQHAAQTANKRKGHVKATRTRAPTQKKSTRKKKTQGVKEEKSNYWTEKRQRYQRISEKEKTRKGQGKKVKMRLPK